MKGFFGSLLFWYDESMQSNNLLAKDEFDFIYSRVPRLTIEIIIKKQDEIFLTRRAIEPCKGQWHLPGGTVRFGEPLNETVKRIALTELGIEVQRTINVGYIEYPSHYQHNLDDPVGLVFEILEYKNELKLNEESMNGGWFSRLPENMHADQDTFLLEHGYLQKS